MKSIYQEKTRPSSQLSQASEFMDGVSKIITSLSIRHPQSFTEFNILLTAIKKYSDSLHTLLSQKNREFLSQTLSKKSQNITLLEQNLKTLLQQMQLYFKQYNRYYSDPNIKIFQQQFNKIQDSYQFRNVDIEKFMPPKSCSVGIQAGERSEEGIEEMSSLRKQFQSKIEELKNRIKQLMGYQNSLEDQNQRLRGELAALENQRKQDNLQFMDKIEKLKSLLEDLNKNMPIQPTSPKWQHTYRSQPQIPKMQPIERRLFYHTMLRQTFQEMEQMRQIQSNQQTQKQPNEDQWRLIFQQATVIEQMINP